MFWCTVRGCESNSNDNKNLSFYRLPKVCARFSEEFQLLLGKRREVWLRAVKIKEEEANEHGRICSLHFTSGKPADFHQVNDEDWLPTLHLPPHVELESQLESPSTKHGVVIRYKYGYKRKKLFATEGEEGIQEGNVAMREDSQMLDGTDDVRISSDSINHTPLRKDVACQTDMTSDHIAQLEEKVATLSLEENSFHKDDTKINYYSGLQNMGLFLLILSQIEDYLDTFRVKNMSNFQKLLLVCMKLRLNLDYKDLSYRFNIPMKTVSSIFKRVVVCLEYSFKELIHWPSRDCLQAKMPDSFRLRFGNCVSVIIDCFEIKTERPSLLKSQAQAFSNYKSSCTAKYLIGISPQSFITFISDGYGGRASDQFITEDCQILDNLLPGDIILADRGFKIEEKVGLYQATLKIPNSTRNRSQLHPWEIENTRNIASVRIHVERVIGCVRSKYRILKGPVPIHIMKENHEGKPVLDYIVRVACIFNNLCNSIVDT